MYVFPIAFYIHFFFLIHWACLRWMCDLCSKSMSSCPLVRLLPASYYFVHIWVMHSHFFGFLRSLVNTQSIGFSLFFSFAVVAVPVVTAVGLMPFLNVFHFLIFVLWSQSWSHCVGSSMASWWYHSDFFPEGFSRQSSPFLRGSLRVGAWCPHPVTVFNSALTFSSFSGWSLEWARLRALSLLYLAPGCAQSLHTFSYQLPYKLHSHSTAFVQGLQPACDLSLSLPPCLAIAITNDWSWLLQQMLPE